MGDADLSVRPGQPFLLARSRAGRGRRAEDAIEPVAVQVGHTLPGVDPEGGDHRIVGQPGLEQPSGPRARRSAGTFGAGAGGSSSRVGLLGPVLGLPADQSTPAAARGARDEFIALPTVLQQSYALTSLGDRPLIVVTAAAEAPPGWVAAQETLPRLSTSSVHRVLAAATHNSLISGVDVAASSQAIRDVLASVRAGTTLR